MTPEKKQRLQSAVTEAKSTLSGLKTSRETANVELTNIRVRRGELVERRSAAAKLSAESAEKKTALARQQVKGERSAAEVADDLAAARSDAEAAETELDSCRMLLTATDDEIDALTATIAEADAAIPAAESALWHAVERVEVPDLIEQLQGPLCRLRALLSKSRGSYSRKDFYGVIDKAMDTSGRQLAATESAVETEYL